MSSSNNHVEFLPIHMQHALKSFGRICLGSLTVMVACVIFLMLVSYHALDPSFNIETNKPVQNWLGIVGSYVSDMLLNIAGFASFLVPLFLSILGYRIIRQYPCAHLYWRMLALFPILCITAISVAIISSTPNWASTYGAGGYIGFELHGHLEFIHLHILKIFGNYEYFDMLYNSSYIALSLIFIVGNMVIVNWLCYGERKHYVSVLYFFHTLGLIMMRKPLIHASTPQPFDDAIHKTNIAHNNHQDILVASSPKAPSKEHDILTATKKKFSHERLVALWRIMPFILNNVTSHTARKDHDQQGRYYVHNPLLDDTYYRASSSTDNNQAERHDVAGELAHANPIIEPMAEVPALHIMDESPRHITTSPVPSAFTPEPSHEAQQALLNQTEMTLPEPNKNTNYQHPSSQLLSMPPASQVLTASDESLQEKARLLETTLKDFGVKGTISQIHPGPVVTLYELEPAPGTKTSRVIGLSDDIARSMSALSVRIATVPGRSVIGIEMPNSNRESVFLRELLESKNFKQGVYKLPVILGKDIGGNVQIADLASMPHLLIAGTTGSGKSVGLNAMILSLLYRYKPSECKFIMIDPKMLELSVYDRIPHLLSPVVTEPKKAVVALKWAVGEMEERYRAMSRMGVRNIEGYNTRIKEALISGEVISRKIQVGFDSTNGEPLYEEEEFEAKIYPFIVVVVDEMADLMLVAGKEIEANIQRLAQMARAAGIHLIMATQRPSVDVITGTIKANFPTRISFMVTSKIDSRTILGEQGAEQLLGKGDMLYMAPGGRISRIHGPFVDDKEVEHICDHLRRQGVPDYVDAVTDDPAHDEMAQFEASQASNGDDLYNQAVQLVAREGKASTSFIQRHLQIGYNRAARIIEQMEKEEIVSPANHVGKRDVLIGNHAA